MLEPYIKPEPMSGLKIFPEQVPFATVEPCIQDARLLVKQIQSRLNQQRNTKLRDAFTALADGDTAVGLLAFYLWRRRGRRWR